MRIEGKMNVEVVTIFLKGVAMYPRGQQKKVLPNRLESP